MTYRDINTFLKNQFELIPDRPECNAHLLTPITGIVLSDSLALSAVSIQSRF